MQCEDLLKALNEYVDGTLEPGVCEQLQAHLKDCNPCRVVIDNVRHTIALYRAGEEEKLCELPLELRQRLREALRAKWSENRS
jgi:predicted anti-sigma-YlaC factor YlaD